MSVSPCRRHGYSRPRPREGLCQGEDANPRPSSGTCWRQYQTGRCEAAAVPMPARTPRRWAVPRRSRPATGVQSVGLPWGERGRRQTMESTGEHHSETATPLHPHNPVVGRSHGRRRRAHRKGYLCVRSDGVGSGKRNHWREVVRECHDQGGGRGGVPLFCWWRRGAPSKRKTGGGQTQRC